MEGEKELFTYFNLALRSTARCTSRFDKGRRTQWCCRPFTYSKTVYSTFLKQRSLVAQLSVFGETRPFPSDSWWSVGSSFASVL